MVCKKLKKFAVIVMTAVIAITGTAAPAAVSVSAAENSEIMPLDSPVNFHETLRRDTEPIRIGSYIYRGNTAGITIHLSFVSPGGYPIRFMVENEYGAIHDTVTLYKDQTGVLTFPPGLSSGDIYAYNPLGAQGEITIGGYYSY